jgi:hypothetical protein
VSSRNKWTTNMRGFAKQRQDDRRSLDLQELAPQLRQQYQILGGTHLSWLDRSGPALLAERAAPARVCHWDTAPHTVIISDLPGLLAAREIIHPESITRSALTEEEYETFVSVNPDPEYRRHVVFRNVFLPLQDQPLLARARLEHPIRADEEYWMHREESIMGKLFARTAFHLWRWDGERYDLLAEAFTRYIS